MNDELDKTKQLSAKLEKAKKQIAQLESRLEDVFRFARNSNDVFYRFRLHPDMGFEFLSPSVENLTGYSPEEFFDDPMLIQKVVHPEDKAVLDGLVNTPEKYDAYTTYRFIHKDGRIIWTEGEIHKVIDDQGRNIAVEAVIRDITARKEAEEKLIKSEEHYRTLFESTGTAMLVVDRNATIIASNSEFERMSGYSRDEIEGKMSGMVFAGEPERVEQYHLKRLANADDVPLVYESSFVAKDGTKKDVLVHIAILPGTQDTIASLLDITDRKKEEDIRVKRSEEKYRLLAENATDIIWMRNMDMNVTYISPSVYTVRGFTQEEAAAQTIEDSLTEESAKLAREALKEELILQDVDKNRTRTLELEATCKDGTTIWTEVTSRFLRDADGSPTGILGISRNINDRKKVEDALRESEQNTRLLYKNFPVPTYTWWKVGDDFHFIDYNDAAKETTKGKVGDYLGVKMSEFIKDYPELIEDAHRCFDKQETFQKEVVYKYRTTGEIKNIINTYAFIPPDRVVITQEDITARKAAKSALKASEARYQLLMKNSTDVIWTMDLDQNFTYVSPSVQRIFGYTVKEALENKVEQIMPVESLQKILNGIRNEVAAGSDLEFPTAPMAFEVELFKKDRKRIWGEIVISFIKQPVTDEIYIQGVTRDNTEKRKAKIRQKELEEQLRHSQRLETIGTLAGGIAHDVNNILQSIFNNIYIGLDSVSEQDPIKANLHRVLSAGRRAKSLVEQILTFSRQVDQEQKPIKIDILVQEVVNMLKQTISPNIRISHKKDKSLGAIVADPSQVHQVIMNLATNAIHAMNESGGELEFKVRTIQVYDSDIKPIRGLDPGGYVHLQVSDNGAGMDKRTLSRIFEPFFTTKQVGQGTGLGLSVAHGIVTAHGGKISAKSQPGKGTVFNVYLPRQEIEAQDNKYDQVTVESGKGSILFVEDDRNQLETAQKILIDVGYDVQTFDRAEEALAAFEDNPENFDVIVTDQMMPGMSGLEMAARMMQMQSGLKVILISGKTDDKVRSGADQLGIEKVLTKPTDPKEMIFTIQQLLKHK